MSEDVTVSESENECTRDTTEEEEDKMITKDELLNVKEGDIKLDIRRLVNDINGKSDDEPAYDYSIEGGIRVCVKNVNYDVTFYNITAGDYTVVFHNNIHGNPADQPFQFDVDVEEAGEDYEVPGITPVRIDLGVDINDAEYCWIESVSDGRKFHLSDYLYPEKEYVFDSLALRSGQLVKITIIYNPDRRGRKYKHDIIDAVGLVTDIGWGYRRLIVRCNPNENSDIVHAEEIYLHPEEFVNGRIKEFSIEKIEV